MSKDANSSTPSTPNGVLYTQWSVLLNKIILQDDIVDISWDWLTANPQYSVSEFWSQAVGSQARPPLVELFATSSHSTYVLPQLKKAVESLPPELQHDQFNRPGSDGKVLLHLLWSKVVNKSKEKSNYGSGPSGLSEYCKQFVEVLGKTDSTHWTWLDKEDDRPGDGFRRNLMALLEGKPYEQVEVLANASLEALNEVYPAVPLRTDPSESPWKTALNQSSIQALLTLGHRIDEPVKIGEYEAPAWQWLLLNSALRGQSTARYIVDTATEQGVDGVGQWVEQINRLKKEWSPLNPDTRRATTGYVANIIGWKEKDGSTKFDVVGSSPLDHLLAYRADLFMMFSSKASCMDTQEFVSRFMQPDLAGVPAVLRYFSRASEENLPALKSLLELHECWEDPTQLLKQRGGLFRFNEEMGPWENMPHSFLCQINPRRLSAHDLSDPEVFFGSLPQQQYWVEFWEQNANLLPAVRKQLQEEDLYQVSKSKPDDPLLKRFTAVAYSQLELFLANAETPSWEAGLDPALRNILHVACCYLTTGWSSQGNKKHFSNVEKLSAEARSLPAPKGRFDSTPSWSGVKLSRDPPETISPVLLDFLASPEGKVVLIHLDSTAGLPNGKYGNMMPDSDRASWEKWVLREKLRNVASASIPSPCAPSERIAPKM